MQTQSFNQYNVAILASSLQSVGSALLRNIAERLGRGPVLVIGGDKTELESQFREEGFEPVFWINATDVPGGDSVAIQTAVYYFSAKNRNDQPEAALIARLTSVLVLVPMDARSITDRPKLVMSLAEVGFVPDYDCDLDVIGTVVLRNHSVPITDLAFSAEHAIAGAQEKVRKLESKLKLRMTELEAAESHIQQLDDNILKLKETKRQLREMKQKRQELRKSPERRIGQVLLAPYLLPRKLLRRIGKDRRAEKLQPASESAQQYQRWLARHFVPAARLPLLREEARGFAYRPLVSIITPVFNAPVAWLNDAVDSVLAQVYKNWELMLIDDASTELETSGALEEIARRDSRIRLLKMERNGGISAASNHGIAHASGEWISILDHDDLLEPDAVFETVKLLQRHRDADLIYSDEDKLTEHGFDAPLLKPDWSPDFMLSYNYICHFTTLRRSLVNEVGGFRSECDGSQDYDLFLRIIEKTDRIHHIPRVLYHWRRTANSTSDNIRRKPQALEAGKRAIGEYLDRLGEDAHVVVDWPTHAYRVKRPSVVPPSVSIILRADFDEEATLRCIERVVGGTDYTNFEIVVVADERQSRQLHASLDGTGHRVLHLDASESSSAAGNLAARETGCDLLLFLDGSADPISPDWLDVLADHARQSGVGAAGPRLLRRDETVAHAGIVLGVGGLASAAFEGLHATEPGVSRQLQVTRNYSAVSGGCLLTRRAVFDEVGGFDVAAFPDVFNDLDYCLRIGKAGYRIVYTPFSNLYCNIATPCAELDTRAAERFRERWSEVLAHDPYYNGNLSRVRADFSLGENQSP